MYMKCGHNLVCTLYGTYFNATNKGIMETSFYIKALRIGALRLIKDEEEPLTLFVF